MESNRFRSEHIPALSLPQDFGKWPLVVCPCIEHVEAAFAGEPLKIVQGEFVR